MSQRGIVLYFEMHQPYRLQPFSVFDIGQGRDYFDLTAHAASWSNRAVFERVADKSYRPMLSLLEELARAHADFRFSLSLTGTFIEQARDWAPEVLDRLRRLVASGRVELLAETYHHSLAFFYNTAEFERQVKLHRELIQHEFGVTPRVFRNTELAYSDTLAQWADSHGYKGILAEGWDPILEWRSPNYTYRPYGTSQISLLLRNYRLSDDIAFRFSDQGWAQWPLSVDTYQGWLNDSCADAPLINLFMDFETFGEHQWHDTGIFHFFRSLVDSWLEDDEHTFYTASQAIDAAPAAGVLSMPHTVTWADSTRDLSAWSGNSLQHEALRHLYDMGDAILRSGDQQLIDDWRHLQTSDHFYYLCTKGMSDGDVHAYFSPYQSPYDAFLYYLNALRDLRWRLINHPAPIGGING